MNSKSLSLAALLALAAASSTQAAMVYFSTTASGAQTPSNPVVTYNVGVGSTVTGTLYVWSRIDPATEALAGLGLNVAATQVGDGSISTVSTVKTTKNADNSSRWDAGSAGTINQSGGLLVKNLTETAISGTAINMNTFDAANYDTPSVADSGNDYKLWQLNYQIVAPSSGTTTYSLFFQTGSSLVSYGQGAGGPNINYGIGDAAVAGKTSGAQSQLADATILVSVPEPASLSLLGLGAMGLVARRRRA